MDQYQWKYHSLIAKYNTGKYKNGSFHGGSNIHFNLIKYEDKIVIKLILQSCILHCYHMYLLYQVMYRMAAMICQNLYMQ